LGQKEEAEAIAKPTTISNALQELIDKANSSFEKGKHYVVLAYEQALKDDYTPQGAKKMLLREIKIFGKSTIYACLPDEAKRTYTTGDEEAEENLQKLQHFQALENLQKLQQISDNEIIEKLGISLRPYDVWNFAALDLRFGKPYPGNTPADIVFNALYFFTQQGDLLVAA
jgi:hypothetical protein